MAGRLSNLLERYTAVREAYRVCIEESLLSVGFHVP